MPNSVINQGKKNEESIEVLKKEFARIRTDKLIRQSLTQ